MTWVAQGTTHVSDTETITLAQKHQSQSYHANMNLSRLSHQLPVSSIRSLARFSSKTVCKFSMANHEHAEGDTGSVRRGGEPHADPWTKREAATENLYVKEREKSIMVLLKEKIAAQEAVLAKDRAILAAMEDRYGHASER